MELNSPSASAAKPASQPRLLCFVNGIFASGIGGGDVYFSYMATAALASGYPIHFFGGHALKNYLAKQNLPLNLTLTDDSLGQLGDVTTFSGQLRLLWDFGRRLRGSLSQLNEVRSDDIAYAMSDYLFDTIPLIRCRARAKVLYLGMIAPSFKQIVFKSRGDVTSTRLASIYYWFNQQLSLRWFRRIRGGMVTYSHPEMRDYLLNLGYNAAQLFYVPNGSDVAAADRVPAQPKQFDLAWVGRVHPQKGIDDLLATLDWLKKIMPDFRAVIVGKSQEKLEPLIRVRGLAKNVIFSGLVSEEEKFRLLKSSRVFAMPSHYESWGIVVGEALAADLPVVAYRLDCYPLVFGDFVRYVAPFDLEAFQRTVEDEIRKQRAGKNYLATMDGEKLKGELSWTTAQEKFVTVLSRSDKTLQAMTKL
ncbi:MAG TPA: glycosyltransferase family 4 protein [Verrucomicrobiae bacterium]|jgi:glycosyltransferase involved in cell wall biosynthesis